MGTESLRRLLEPEGWALLASLPPYEEAEAVRLNESLRAAGHDADLVATVLTQQHLRARARAKLGEFAANMLFTEKGLQQATRLVVAAHHANRYRQAGCTRVADLGCGLGADSIALAALGIAVDGVEQDETTAAFATINLMPFPNARVVNGDALSHDLSGYDGVFADPARRTERGRVFDPEDYSPPLPRLFELRTVVPALGVKVAPGIGYGHLPADTHAQWVSVGGDVVEAGLWFGPLARTPGRSALVIDAAGRSAALDCAARPDEPAERAPVGPLQRYLYEPDGAVIRAGGVATLARRLGATTVSESIAYLTGPSAVTSPFAEAFEVLDHLPYSVKRLSSYLAARGIGRLEIKKRGVDVVPDRLRAQLGLRGDSGATVVLTRLEGRHSAVIVRRMRPGAGTMDS
ncbi:MAG TPA: SAM-dependent methyltransferase [Demequina sp.]|nr:SAM-dependent methyltransferase [Demequina sp.]